ncbi:hypothetical protein ACVDFE_01680 [Lentzea chajnantorensis]
MAVELRSSCSLEPDGNEKSKSFPDRQKKRADDFLLEVESNKREGKYVDPKAGEVKFDPGEPALPG